jgi:hypothetical protein
MSDEQGNPEASNGDAKVSKRARLRGALRKGVDKIKRKDDEDKQDTTFTLGDDVNDFLAGGLPPPSDRFAIATPGHGGQAGSTTEPRGGNQPNMLYRTAPEDMLPQFATTSRASVPRIDVSQSPRFPDAREIGSPALSYNSSSTQRPRGHSESSTRGRAGRGGLKVQFADVPPTIIGEGGDEAEMPTTEISMARARARSHSPNLERPRYLDSPDASQVRRKAVPVPSQRLSPVTPQNQELEMSLLPSHSDPFETLDGSASLPQTTNKGFRLRMRVEEGKTLREAFQEANQNSIPK